MRNRLFRQPILVTGLFLSLTCPLSADVVFTLLPSDGKVFGEPGSLVGWGYSLTNTDLSDWFMSTDLNSDSFSNGTPTLLFDFPILAPGESVTEAFDPVNNIGLFELQWDSSAPAGFVNSGNFVLSGQWWDGDPLNGENFIADAVDTTAAYSATVNSPTTSAPEPSSALLLGSGIGLVILCGGIARRRLATTTV